ncbi:hypothetical protein QQF64_035966 [Cirrhinus molitorella]|uniref:Uncharacterized protein n=1 Tax=Cirrhinus molitorella TaxID=172907 RepID=A0ABR3NH79_9TELE
METADRDTQQLRKIEESAATVHKVKEKITHQKYACYRCKVGGDPKWLSGVVVQQTGPVSYKVRDPLSTTVYRRHGDQLRPRYSSSETYDEQLRSRNTVETQNPEKEMTKICSPDSGSAETSAPGRESNYQLNHLNPWLQAQWVCDFQNGLLNYHNVLDTE